MRIVLEEGHWPETDETAEVAVSILKIDKIIRKKGEQ